jgi:hypothetical protein
VKGGRYPEVIFIVKRQIIAMCMESPLYFTIPVRERLELVKQLERRVHPTADYQALYPPRTNYSLPNNPG